MLSRDRINTIPTVARPPTPHALNVPRSSPLFILGHPFFFCHLDSKGLSNGHFLMDGVSTTCSVSHPRTRSVEPILPSVWFCLLFFLPNQSIHTTNKPYRTSAATPARALLSRSRSLALPHVLPLALPCCVYLSQGEGKGGGWGTLRTIIYG